ncbi:hypothetical protein [Vibrio sp. F13]|uniref:hypothetical protein n=1 Tax=Vibrio sp. F13 TaxID=2070777 RepID=UPI0010BD0E68|nr:hypothetical protein [Vibrio sp. F13]TKG06069.1 hypothetical protein FCV67_15935 [Vibrio sp. F13]
MKKGLMMTPIATALARHASADVSHAILYAMRLCLETKMTEDKSEFLDRNTARIVTNLVHSINDSVMMMNAIYVEIEGSVSPELFFDGESVAELSRADGMMRALEKRLRVLYNGLVKGTGEGTEPVKSAKEIRRSVAKLRTCITCLVRLNHQLNIVHLSDDKPAFELTSEKVAMLKAASFCAASFEH